MSKCQICGAGSNGRDLCPSCEQEINEQAVWADYYSDRKAG